MAFGNPVNSLTLPPGATSGPRIVEGPDIPDVLVNWNPTVYVFTAVILIYTNDTDFYWIGVGNDISGSADPNFYLEGSYDTVNGVVQTQNRHKSAYSVTFGSNLNNPLSIDWTFFGTGSLITGPVVKLWNQRSDQSGFIRPDLGNWTPSIVGSGGTNPNFGVGATITGKFRWTDSKLIKVSFDFLGNGGAGSTKGTGTWSIAPPAQCQDSRAWGMVGHWAMNDAGSALRSGAIIFDNDPSNLTFIEDGAGAKFGAASVGAAAGFQNCWFRGSIEYPVLGPG